MGKPSTEPSEVGGGEGKPNLILSPGIFRGCAGLLVWDSCVCLFFVFPLYLRIRMSI